jgi:hypothetical protein
LGPDFLSQFIDRPPDLDGPELRLPAVAPGEGRRSKRQGEFVDCNSDEQKQLPVRVLARLGCFLVAVVLIAIS